jgi:hypothetical protein
MAAGTTNFPAAQQQFPAISERSKTVHYCFRCGNWRTLNAQRMCAACTTMWLSAKPAERRKLLRVVGSEPVVQP